MQLQQRLNLLDKHALSSHQRVRSPDLAWEDGRQLVIIILPTCSAFRIHLITANPEGISIFLPNINLNILSIAKNRTAIHWKLEIF